MARRFHGETSGLLHLDDLPWWTTADQAELDLLIACLIKGVHWHLERCPVAEARRLEGYPFWCQHLSGAVQEVIEWRDLREAYSRAVWLRRLLSPGPVLVESVAS